MTISTHDAQPDGSGAPPAAPEALPIGDDAGAIWPAGSVRRAGRGGFLARQFELPTTGAQTLFDGVFGIALPLVCLVFDPIVFRSPFGGSAGLLTRYDLPAQVLIGMAMAALVLSWTPVLRSAVACAALAGMFAGGALFALALGLALLPLAVIGLPLAGLGALGFTPLLTGFVFARGGVRLWCRHAYLNAASPARGLALIVGLGLMLGAPAGLHVIRHGIVRLVIRDLKSGAAADAARAAARLKRWAPVLPLDRVAREAARTPDRAEATRLAAAYEQAAGRSVGAWEAEQLD